MRQLGPTDAHQAGTGRSHWREFPTDTLEYNDCSLVPLQLKVFPDGARNAVYAFLGIPYAQPPLGPLRFAVS